MSVTVYNTPNINGRKTADKASRACTQNVYSLIAIGLNEINEHLVCCLLYNTNGIRIYNLGYSVSKICGVILIGKVICPISPLTS